MDKITKIVLTIFTKLGGVRLLAKRNMQVRYFLNEEQQLVLECIMAKNLATKNGIDRVLITYNMATDNYRMEFINSCEK